MLPEQPPEFHQKSEKRLQLKVILTRYRLPRCYPEAALRFPYSKTYEAGNHETLQTESQRMFR